MGVGEYLALKSTCTYGKVCGNIKYKANFTI